jgi:glycosyltransferase involved in cell wall biosynthesis
LGGWRIIIVYDGSSPNVDLRDSKIRSFLRGAIAQSVDALITNSHQGKAYLTEFLRAKESCVFVRPYQVPDAKALSAHQKDTEGSDSGWRRPVFLFVGQVIQRKGIHILLEACALLQKQGYRDYTVIVVGDGAQRDELKDFSQKHGLQDRIQWVGWVEYGRLNAYFRSADVFVFPTLEDIWGMVVLEAMFFGKPVVCSKWAGASEMVVEGENGYVFDPHAPEELAKIMGRFIDEPELSISMSHKSQQLIAQHTPEAAAQFLTEVTSFVLSMNTPRVSVK